MKVLFLSVLFRHPSGESKVGGGELSNRKLLEVLAERHDIFVVSAIGHKMWGECVNGVVYYDMSSSSKFSWIPSFIRNSLSKVLYRWTAPKLMKDISPDVVLCGTLEYSTAARYRRQKRVPIGAFIRAFENFSSYNECTPKQRVKRGVRQLMYGNTQNAGVNRLDFLLPNSDFIDRLCAENFSVASRYTIYPPITLPKYKDISDANAAGHHVRSILMVSGAKKKGRDLFLKLAESLPEIEFIIVGYLVSDKEKAAFADNVRIHPWVKNPEELIAKADLVLVPSIWEEPFGRISVEALQCGTPVLVSKIGGLPETVGYQEELLVEPEDELAWRTKIEAYLDYPPAFVEANLRAMESSTKYSISSQVEALEKALVVEVQRMCARERKGERC